MSNKVYMVEVKGFVLVEAKTQEDAGMAVEAKLSDTPNIEAMTYSANTLNLKQARALSLQHDYAIDHCGMTVGEFLEEQESD